MNTTSTKSSRKGLQPTPQAYDRLTKKADAGGTLTPEEQAVCEIGYAIEHARHIPELLLFTGFDVQFSCRPESEIARTLVNAETLPTQAWAYRLMIGALLDTPGALEGIFLKLYTDLGQLHLSGDDITLIFNTIMKDGKVRNG